MQDLYETRDTYNSLTFANSNCVLVHQYIVDVYTGDMPDAGTKANVHMDIFGQRGNTGVRKLLSSQTEGLRFTKGKVTFKTLHLHLFV